MMFNRLINCQLMIWKITITQCWSRGLSKPNDDWNTCQYLWWSRDLLLLYDLLLIEKLMGVWWCSKDLPIPNFAISPLYNGDPQINSPMYDVAILGKVFGSSVGSQWFIITKSDCAWWNTRPCYKSNIMQIVTHIKPEIWLCSVYVR